MTDGSGETESTILRSKAEGVGTITLNRPDRLNAFTQAMLGEWAAALTGFGTDPEVNVIVITGAGRAFCSGGDTRDVAGRSGASAITGKTYMMDHVYSIARALENIDKPVLAGLNGLARAGGLDMALMCDIRIAASSATFAESYINIGMMSGSGGAYFLPRLVGTSRALELLWTGDSVTAEEAQRLGFVDHVVPDDEFADFTFSLARKIAAQPSAAVRFYKRAVYQGAEQSLRAHLDAVSSHLAILRSTPEHLERMEAIAKKKPSK